MSFTRPSLLGRARWGQQASLTLEVLYPDEDVRPIEQRIDLVGFGLLVEQGLYLRQLRRIAVRQVV